MADQAAPTTEKPMKPTRPEPTIERKDALLVAGLRYEGKNEHGEIPAMWDEFLPRVSALVADASRFAAYGVARALPKTEESGAFEYLAGVAVASLDNLPPGMVGWGIPALTYAVLPAHDVPNIGPVSHYFYGEWLPQSQEYEMGEGLMVEYYPETFGQDSVLYLCFPVKRK